MGLYKDRQASRNGHFLNFILEIIDCNQYNLKTSNEISLLRYQNGLYRKPNYMQPITKAELLYSLDGIIDNVISNFNKEAERHVPGNALGPICLISLRRAVNVFNEEFEKRVNILGYNKNPETANLIFKRHDELLIASIIYKAMLLRGQHAKTKEEDPFYHSELSPEEKKAIDEYVEGKLINLHQQMNLPPVDPDLN